jgi:hypothetical protein
MNGNYEAFICVYTSLYFPMSFYLVVRRIGTVARMELQKVLNNTVHLVLDVKVLEAGRDLITPLEEVNGDPLFL